MFRTTSHKQEGAPRDADAKAPILVRRRAGKTNVFLSNILDTSTNRIGVRVYIGNRVADSVLPQLEQQKEAIEREIGDKLQWNPTPEKRDKIIGLFRKIELANKDAWPEYCEWLAHYVDRFRRAFMPRIRNIVVTEPAVDRD
ncbi:MAG: DUF4268 domain-containing protein [Betaproteobacteria bacterium]|nr:DUF4268 domain-containing protein [Betaproteobacteria bacterium]